MASLGFEPLIPPALWVTLAVLSVGALVGYGVRRPARIARSRWIGALLLNALGAAAVLVVLLNPTWTAQVPPPAGKPQLTVLVDTSASMATPDADGGATRLQAAARGADELAQKLADHFDVRTLGFDRVAGPADVAELATRAADGALTNLAAAIRTSLQEDRVAGQALAVLSDGIHNSGPTSEVLDAVRLAQAQAVPIYTMTLGGQPVVRDLALEFGAAQELAFVEQRVPVHVRVRQRGLPGVTATVVLRQDDQELGRETVVLDDESPHDIRYEVQQEHPGLYRYEVEVEPVPEEGTRLNNTGTFVLRVVDQPIRVLLLEGNPYWDAKFLMRTLAADPLVELRSVVRLADSRLVQRTLRRAETQPASEDQATAARTEDWRIIDDATSVLGSAEALGSIQVLVLGRDAEFFLSDEALAQVRDWLARAGGSLVCYRGAPVAQVNQALGTLLPVRWAAARESRFRMRLTERGSSLQWLPGSDDESGAELARLPTLARTTQVEHPKPLAVVLAAADSPSPDKQVPVVTYQPYGAGRVVVIEGAGMWRWAFLAPQYQAHDDVYGSLWHSLLRWLIFHTGLLPGQMLSLQPDKVSFSTGERASATLLLRAELVADQVPVVELDGDALPAPQIVSPTPLGDEPGTYRVVFGELPAGRYRARVLGASGDDVSRQAVFDVRGFLEESLDLKARPDLMARMAQDSDGAVLGADPAGEIAAHFRAHLARSRPPALRHNTAWDRWWLLLAVWAAWSSAWALRRSGGLI